MCVCERASESNLMLVIGKCKSLNSYMYERGRGGLFAGLCREILDSDELLISSPIVNHGGCDT